MRVPMRVPHGRCLCAALGYASRLYLLPCPELLYMTLADDCLRRALTVWRAICILSLGLALLACRSRVDAVATVNGRVITRQAFDKAVRRALSKYQSPDSKSPLPPKLVASTSRRALYELIENELISQKAKSLGVEIGDEELSRKYIAYRKKYGTEQALQAFLTRTGITEADLKEDLRIALLRDEVFNKLSGLVVVTDEQIQTYYDQHKASFQIRDQVKVSRILLKVPGDASASERRAAATKLEALRRQALAPGADFAALAKSNSQGQEASRGGELGWIPRQQMGPQWDAAVFALEPAAISAPIVTSRGVEIVKVVERSPARLRPLSEVRDAIRAAIEQRTRSENLGDALRELKADAQVEQFVEFPVPLVSGPAEPSAGLDEDGRVSPEK
jgi:peptidyl-prolyl cis-trans isomerase C